MSPEVVLSNFNKNNCIKLLERMKPVQGNILKKSKLKNAAVLVPLCKINEQLGFLYTVRPLHLKSNGGEVAFPGGMQEASDL